MLGANLLIVSSLFVQPVVCHPANKEERGFNLWPLWGRLLLCTVVILLSALFCGLTIGLLGIDTVTLEIIASAGVGVERGYAEKLLPVRRLGHRLLVTLVLGNMLANVLTAQLVAAILQANDLVNFVVATLIIFIIADIIPTSYCNKGNNGLKAGVKSLSVVQAALIVLYPVAKPLGMLLDCAISHDAGQLYDKRELKILIRMHCEKYSERSGLNQDELRMMLSALEMNEVTVDTAMTALDRTLMLEASEPIDAALQRRLWEYGKSRVPVYDGDRSRIVGVLFIKDLVNVATLTGDEELTVGQFILEHPRDLLVVKANVLLPDALRIFESHYTQMVFVESAATQHSAGGIPAVPDISMESLAAGAAAGAGPGTGPSASCLPQLLTISSAEFLCGLDPTLAATAATPAPADSGDSGTHTSPLVAKASSSFLAPPSGLPAPTAPSSRHYRNEPPRVPELPRRVRFQDEEGDGSLEMVGTDSLMALTPGRAASSLTAVPVKSSIKAPREEPIPPPDSVADTAVLDSNSMADRTIVGIVTLEDVIERLIASEIYDEDEYNLGSDGATSDTNSDIENELLLRSVKRSASLQKQPVRMPRVNLYSYGLTQCAIEGDDDLSEDQKWALAAYMTRAFVFFAAWSISKMKFLLDEIGDTRVYLAGDEVLKYGLPRKSSSDEDAQDGVPAAAATATDLPPPDPDPSQVLYTAGVETTTFTLLLSGGISVLVGPEGFRTELRSFSSLAEDVFINPEFTPDYMAVVSRTSRLIQISHDDIYRVERKINAIRLARRRHPVKLSIFDGNEPPEDGPATPEGDDEEQLPGGVTAAGSGWSAWRLRGARATEVVVDGASPVGTTPATSHSLDFPPPCAANLAREDRRAGDE